MRTIAVIDDEHQICDLIQSALENSEVVVHCAGTAAYGLEMLTAQHFHLAVIDIDLPDGSGLALAEVAVNEDIPVVLMSGHVSTVEAIAELGFHCLSKPFQLSMLETEAVQVMDDSDRFVKRLIDSIARLRANICVLENGTGGSRRLIDIGRSIVDRAASVTSNC